MSKENITFIYSAIIRAKHTILSEFTEFSGNFSQIITQIMKDIIIKIENIPNICRSYFYYGKYALFFLKYNKIYIITMFPNVKLNNKEIVFAFLYSIFDSLKSKKEIDIEKMDKMKAYTLSTFSEIFTEKIKLFSSNCDNFIKYIKNLQTFQIFELPECSFDSDIQIPVLSKIQTHAEKKKVTEDEELPTNSQEKNSLGTSFNSMMTYDSFKDDFLNLGQEMVNNNNNSLSNININIIENDKSENLIKNIEVQQLYVNNEEIKAINTIESNASTNKIEKNIPNNKNNNKFFNCSFKVIIILIVIVILAILGIVFFVRYK